MQNAAEHLEPIEIIRGLREYAADSRARLQLRSRQGTAGSCIVASYASTTMWEVDTTRIQACLVLKMCYECVHTVHWKVFKFALWIEYPTLQPNQIRKTSFVTSTKVINAIQGKGYINSSVSRFCKTKSRYTFLQFIISGGTIQQCS